MSARRELDDYPDIMDTDDVAELLGYAVTEVRVLARTGRIPAHRAGKDRRWQFDRDELVGWVRQRRVLPEDGADD